MINERLAVTRGLTPETISAIKLITADLKQVLARPLMQFESYKDAVDYVDAAETVLQRLWQFNYDPNYRTYKFDFKDCICPKMDNEDRCGSGYFVYNRGCPVHRHLFEE